MAKITIDRPFEWCNQSNINIYIDDKKVGELNSGKSIDFEVLPGTHKVAVKKKSMMGFNKPVTVELGNEENKTISVTSFKYARVMMPILLLVLFTIYLIVVNLFDFEGLYYVIVAAYAVVVFLFMYFNARTFHYKLEEIIAN